MESTNNQTPARSSEEQLKAKYGGKLYRVGITVPVMMRARKSSPTTSSAPPSPAMTATSRPLRRASPRQARRSCWTRSSTRTPSV